MHAELYNSATQESVNQSKRVDLLQLLRKAKEVLVADTNFEQKLVSIFKLLVEECKKMVMDMLKNCGWVKCLMESFFTNG